MSCSAADSVGNVVHGSFHVIVRDRTPPAINAPNVSLTATAANGIHKTDAALASYLAHVTASDLVSAPTLTNSVPDLLPIGQTTVTFTATDAAGNAAGKRVVITVLPPGKTAPPADLTPPANPTGIAAKAGNRRVDLSWKTSGDAAYVTVTLIAGSNGKAGKEVCRGSVRRVLGEATAERHHVPLRARRLGQGRQPLQGDGGQRHPAGGAADRAGAGPARRACAAAQVGARRQSVVLQRAALAWPAQGALRLAQGRSPPARRRRGRSTARGKGWRRGRTPGTCGLVSVRGRQPATAR